MFTNISHLNLLNELQLHVYGNNLTKEEIVYIIELISKLRLKRLMFSFMEYLIEGIEAIDPDIRNAFYQLDIIEKTIC